MQTHSSTHKLTRQALLALWLCLVAVATLGMSTWAWFTNNRLVETARAYSVTQTQEAQLLLSQTAEFVGAAEIAIPQVNTSASEQLLPVSTADLQHFVTCGAMQDGYAQSFAALQNEAGLYHGRIYLQAVLQGAQPTTRLALYLDESTQAGGSLLTADVDSLLGNAARLGLCFDGGNAVILRLSEQQNPAEARMANTKLGDTVLEENMVLDGATQPLAAVADPAVPIAEYTRSGSTLPQAPLLLMEPQRVYTLDIYFYLEGCDPDCTDAVAYDAGDLHLAFFGYPMEEDGNGGA